MAVTSKNNECERPRVPGIRDVKDVSAVQKRDLLTVEMVVERRITRDKMRLINLDSMPSGC